MSGRELKRIVIGVLFGLSVICMVGSIIIAILNAFIDIRLLTNPDQAPWEWLAFAYFYGILSMALARIYCKEAP